MSRARPQRDASGQRNRRPRPAAERRARTARTAVAMRRWATSAQSASDAAESRSRRIRASLICACSRWRRLTADAAVAEITAKGGNAVAVAGDISQFDVGEQVVASAVDNWGSIDGVVCPAGASTASSLMRRSSRSA